MCAEGIDDARAKLVSKGCTFGSDESGTVVRLTATVPKRLTDEDMPLIAQFPSMKCLIFSQSDITDNGFRHLSSLGALEELYANETLITDDGLQWIAQLPNLRALALPRGVTDTGLRRLSGLANVESITAAGPGITDKAVETLLKFQRLRFVSLGRNVSPAAFQRLSSLERIENVQTFEWMNDSMMVALSTFPQLKHLNLHMTQVTESGLPHLQRMHNLRVLTLPKDTSDAGLINISHMRKLQQLDLRNTRVTNEGLVALKDIKSLSMLTLPPTTTDAAVAQLVEYDLRLSGLFLMGEGYTDACTPSLIALKHLTNIGLWRTKITEQGFQELQRAKPHVRFSRN